MTRPYRNGDNMRCNISQSSRVLRESGQNRGLRRHCERHIPRFLQIASAWQCNVAKAVNGQRAVEIRDPHQSQDVRPLIGPAHLLFLGHPRRSPLG